MICGLLLDAERTGPPSAALMGMNMIAETLGGRNYSDIDYVGWLTDTGFAEPHVPRFDNGAVIARAPAAASPESGRRR